MRRRPSLYVLLLFSFSSGQALAEPTLGHEIYRKHCESCHGTDGRGLLPGTPDLSRPDAMMLPDSVLMQIIQNGSGTMPAYLGILQPEEMRAVITYMRTMIQ